MAICTVMRNRRRGVIRRVAQSIPAKVVSDRCQDRRPGVVMTTGHDSRPPDIHHQRPDVGSSRSTTTPLIIGTPSKYAYRLSPTHHHHLGRFTYTYIQYMRSLRTRNIIIYIRHRLSLFFRALTAVYTRCTYTPPPYARDSLYGVVVSCARPSRPPASSNIHSHSHRSETFHPVPTHVPRAIITSRCLAVADQQIKTVSR